jgi:hypothetical protein
MFMLIETYLQHKSVWDKSLDELIQAGGSRRYDPRMDSLIVGHLQHLEQIGFVEEVDPGGRDGGWRHPRPTFRITDAGRAACGSVLQGAIAPGKSVAAS